MGILLLQTKLTRTHFQMLLYKKYSLIVYLLKLISYFCCEFKEGRFFLLRFL